MRVLLCGGGTAGHVMPAIAMSEIIEKSFPESVVAFAGREKGAENDAYTKTGRKLYTVDISGISRSLSINNIKTVFKVIKSGRKARNIIQEFEPDVIIGTGGYVCYPFIRQGQRMNIKTVIHESNVSPGLVTKLLGGKCDKLLLNLEGTRAHLKKTANTAVVGNPTRAEFGRMTRSEARKKLGVESNQTLIVSFGGSLGAEILNETVADLIKKHTVGNTRIRHIHSTGRNHYAKIKEAYPELFSKKANVDIFPYIDNMPTLLTAADLAITRSGAITVSELCRSATPSILIPSPNVTGNHQYANARYMESVGAAVLIEEKELTCDVLHDAVMQLILNKEQLLKMSSAAAGLYTRDTNERIAQVLAELTAD